jgi:hypothetical protein
MSGLPALLADRFGEVLQRIHACPAFDELSKFGNRPVWLEVGASRLQNYLFGTGDDIGRRHGGDA